MSQEPRTIIAGDSVSWSRYLTGYLPSSGWSLKYRLVSSTISYDINTSASGDSHQVSLTAAETETWQANEYQLVAQVSNGVDRYTIGTTRVTVKPDPTSASYDPRSHAERVLEKIEAALETKATSDKHTITVDGQTIGRYDWQALLDAEKLYRGRVNRQRRAEREKRTGRTSNRLLARIR